MIITNKKIADNQDQGPDFSGKGFHGWTDEQEAASGTPWAK